MLILAQAERVFRVKDPPSPQLSPHPVILTALIEGHWNTVCFFSHLIILQARLIDFLTP